MNKKTENILKIGGILAFLGLAGWGTNKFLKSQKIKGSQKAIQKGNQKDLGINIPEIAQAIGINLGTAYGSLDPRHWTENDQKVKELVLKVPKPLIGTLSSSYQKLYNRNLQQDLQKMLDDYDDVSYLFK